uniref:RING-type E3 ubiquitin transferase n=1 Tax=Hyaloperonospora arabidopsidis (strain Emoy2) TaxID=559515 RepID=M4BTA1_HYAAE
MQAVSTTRERPDMAFISTNDGVHKPIGLPELQQSSTITNHVNLNKSSLKLERSITEPSQYALTFKFDATKACRISVYLVAAEIVEAGTGNLSYALTYADKIPILAQHFSHGMRQTFVLKGGEKEEQTLTKDREKLEHPGSFLDFSGYDADDLVYKADERQFPLIIALEVVSDGTFIQSQSTFCSFFRTAEDNWDVRVVKQKVRVDGVTYEVQEIYGISASVNIAPETKRSDRAEDDHVGISPSTGSGIGLSQEAECIICLCEPRDTIILPCRHMCLCSDCAETLSKRCSMCPVCRTRVEAMLQMRVEV